MVALSLCVIMLVGGGGVINSPLTYKQFLTQACPRMIHHYVDFNCCLLTHNIEVIAIATGASIEVCESVMSTRTMATRFYIPALHSLCKQKQQI